MNIKQYYLGCLSHASYMISDEASRSAVIVDPQRDVDQYLKDARDQGLTIKEVILTHFHADFVAGHLELQEKTGAPISLGAAAHPEYAFQARRDGESLTLGQTRLQFLETPGHTPEAVSLLAFDLSQSPDHPKAVLTGDTLFVGDVGRPDLAVSTGHTAQDLAGQLYDSLHEKLLRLPDDTVVYPAHGPGSLCGSGSLGGKVSTIGRERAENPMLKKGTKADFVSAITANLPELPTYFAHDAQLNQSQHASLDATLARELRPLGAAEVERIGYVLDVRSPDAFAAGHWPGSLNIGLDGRFAQWAGSLVDGQRPLVVVADPGREREALTRLGRIGLENVAGFLEGEVPHPVVQPRVTAQQLAQQLEETLVLDVRGDDEYRNGHIKGSLHIPLAKLATAEIPTDRPIVVHCQSGYRSSMAVSLLAGRGDVSDLTGGIAAWKEAGLPVISGR